MLILQPYWKYEPKITNDYVTKIPATDNNENYLTKINENVLFLLLTFII